jgi:hypothetical protein
MATSLKNKPSQKAGFYTLLEVSVIGVHAAWERTVALAVWVAWIGWAEIRTLLEVCNERSITRIDWVCNVGWVSSVSNTQRQCSCTVWKLTNRHKSSLRKGLLVYIHHHNYFIFRIHSEISYTINMLSKPIITGICLYHGSLSISLSQ